MKIVLKWILLCWCIIGIPYMFGVETFTDLFFGLLFMGLIIGITISDLIVHHKRK